MYAKFGTLVGGWQAEDTIRRHNTLSMKCTPHITMQAEDSIRRHNTLPMKCTPHITMQAEDSIRMHNTLSMKCTPHITMQAEDSIRMHNTLSMKCTPHITMQAEDSIRMHNTLSMKGTPHITMQAEDSILRHNTLSILTCKVCRFATPIHAQGLSICKSIHLRVHPFASLLQQEAQMSASREGFFGRKRAKTCICQKKVVTLRRNAMKGKVLNILLVLVVLFSGCKTTKFVPEGSLLLDKARVRVVNAESDIRNQKDTAQVKTKSVKSKKDTVQIKEQPVKSRRTKGNTISKTEANALASDLKSYLRQKQNTEIFGFWKLQLHVYNTAPVDTTSKANKFFARNAHKVGEAPV
ncbi:MAG: hypothetical protein ACI4BD_06145, partial [Paludibacteraceae bacterium]